MPLVGWGGGWWWSGVYANSSVSQPVCRDAQVCRGTFLSVPPNLRIPKEPYKNSTIFSIFFGIT